MKRLDISIERAKAAEAPGGLLVLLRFEDDREPAGALAAVDERMGGEIGRVLGRADFRAKREETLLLLPRPGELRAERVVLVGLGKRDAFTLESLRRGVGAAVRQGERLGGASLTLVLDALDALGGDALNAFDAARAAAEGATLAAWEFREFKTQAREPGAAGPVESLALLARDPAEAEAFSSGARSGAVAASGENLARDLASRPGNIATPSHLAEVAESIAGEHGLRATILDREAIEREEMGALLAVARGSEVEPRFIVLEHRGGDEGEAPLVLVGKGVTFDSGGISLKPADRMEEMKFDMSGAAAVIGAMQAIAELGIETNVTALVPSTENLPSGRALKPGDIIRSRSGKTIEVVNTDAEGRLILADALSYAQGLNPRAVVDVATLTGACVVALGNHAIGLMGTDDALVDEVRAAGNRTGERCWTLPLWDEYRKQLDSEYADLKNSGGRPAGTITAGWFLREFAGDAPWAHLDIAGTAYGDADAPYLRKGATGVPTRLFVDWVRERGER